MKYTANRPLWVWIALGALAYLLLPWYAFENANGVLSILQVFSDEATANGLVHALRHGRCCWGPPDWHCARRLPPTRRAGARQRCCWLAAA